MKKKSFGEKEILCEGGFLLLSLILWIPILFVCLGLSVTWTKNSQKRIALQSQLDICSVQRVSKRREAFKALIQTNDILRFTNIAVASLRGLSVLGGPLGKLASSMGEKALVQWNHLTARKQEFLIKMLSIEEKNPVCASTKFSSVLSLCEVSPMLTQLLSRTTPSMPDLKAPLIAREKIFANVRCQKFPFVTEIQLIGDASMIQPTFREKYAK